MPNPNAKSKRNHSDSDSELEIETFSYKKKKRISLRAKTEVCDVKANLKSITRSLWLSDIQINQALFLLSNQFRNIGGLVDPVLFQLHQSHNFNPKFNNKSIYILQSNGNHWVLLLLNLFI